MEDMGQGALFPGQQKLRDEAKLHRQWFGKAFMFHAVFIKF